MLELMVARAARLRIEREGVEVGGVGAERQVDAGAMGALDQPLDQVMCALRPLVRDHRLKRIQPFGGFLGVGVIVAGTGWASLRHGGTPGYRQNAPRSVSRYRGKGTQG
ncbi:hypothetical protein D9M69_616330 [compost metagenome]